MLGLTVFDSAESGGATQDRVLGRRRPRRRWTSGEGGSERLWDPARPGRRSGRRRPEHLETTLAILSYGSGLRDGGGKRKGRTDEEPPGCRVKGEDDDVGGGRGATSPVIV
jgi:hypothetical protein